MVDITPVVVCTDCLMIGANGELGGYDPCYVLAKAHTAKMDARWGEPFHGPFSETGEGFFSSASCDTCGETLAGDRFDAVMLSR